MKELEKFGCCLFSEDGKIRVFWRGGVFLVVGRVINLFSYRFKGMTIAVCEEYWVGSLRLDRVLIVVIYCE